MNNNFAQAEKLIGYTFQDKSVLKTAFTHASFANENGAKSNEKLEFLGDSILNFVVAERLFETEKDEGIMTVKRAMTVSRLPLACAVEKLKLFDFYLMGAGAKKDEKLSVKFKSNLFEAVIGAIYVDSKSIDKCKKFIFDNLDTDDCSTADYKSTLQEYVQANKLGKIIYEVTSAAHNNVPLFTAEVVVGASVCGRGSGGRKKEAEKQAAKEACKFFKVSGGNSLTSAGLKC